MSITNSSAAVVRASFVVGAKIEGGAGKLKRNTSLTRSSECSDANPVSSVNALGEQAEETIPFLGFIVCDQCFVIKEKSSCLLQFRIGAMPGFAGCYRTIFDYGCCYQKSQKEIKGKIIFEDRLCICMKVCVAQSGLAVLRRTCISIKCLSSLNRKRHLRHSPLGGVFRNGIQMWFQQTLILMSRPFLLVFVAK